MSLRSTTISNGDALVAYCWLLNKMKISNINLMMVKISAGTCKEIKYISIYILDMY